MTQTVRQSQALLLILRRSPGELCGITPCMPLCIDKGIPQGRALYFHLLSFLFPFLFTYKLSLIPCLVDTHTPSPLLERGGCHDRSLWSWLSNLTSSSYPIDRTCVLACVRVCVCVPVCVCWNECILMSKCSGLLKRGGAINNLLLLLFMLH